MLLYSYVNTGRFLLFVSGMWKTPLPVVIQLPRVTPTTIGNRKSNTFNKWETRNANGGQSKQILVGQRVATHILIGQSVDTHTLIGQSMATHILINQSVTTHILIGQSVATHILIGHSVNTHILIGQSVTTHVLIGQREETKLESGK